ncbi:hypothetical protein [Pseudomonas abieticivorans]|uniref:hypothetical protein n=1 Tax=Pseudomonas abieticivorans TaxID=2931382 RepID=UPI0020BE07D5|nr:hypothetical protein [Pseudomonas sp. PIA16]
MNLKALFALPALAVACGLVFLGWQHYYPVQAASGWQVRLAHGDIPKAAALGIDDQGRLLVSEELRNAKGRIVALNPDGSRTPLIEKLTKPDGMAAFMGGLAFSQEAVDSPVQLWKNGTVTPLFMGNHVQGLKAVGNSLYAIEDRKGQGRLMRYDGDSGQLTVLRDALSESESVETCPDGKMLYTVKAAGEVRQFTEDGKDPVYLSGLKEPTFLLCDERGLWISEDQTHLARLWLLDNSGKLQVILSHLRAPQELLPMGGGKYLLAEGGRDRVIELSTR